MVDIVPDAKRYQTPVRHPFKLPIAVEHHIMYPVLIVSRYFPDLPYQEPVISVCVKAAFLMMSFKLCIQFVQLRGIETLPPEELERMMDAYDRKMERSDR